MCQYAHTHTFKNQKAVSDFLQRPALFSDLCLQLKAAEADPLATELWDIYWKQCGAKGQGPILPQMGFKEAMYWSGFFSKTERLFYNQLCSIRCW